MGNPYRDREFLLLDEVADYVGWPVFAEELPEPLVYGNAVLWPKEDIDVWLDEKRGPGGDQRQEAG